MTLSEKLDKNYFGLPECSLSITSPERVRALMR